LPQLRQTTVSGRYRGSLRLRAMSNLDQAFRNFHARAAHADGSRLNGFGFRCPSQRRWGHRKVATLWRANLKARYIVDQYAQR
jgi:hypothetical protein